MQTAAYPKVVIITNTAINDVDAHGALLQNYFHDWPKECLSQMFQERLAHSIEFCGREYKLTAADRRFGAIYGRLKRSIVGESARPHSAQSKRRGSRESAFRRIAYFTSRLLIQSGLWELIFVPKISQGMAAWIKSFDPDIVYVQGYSLFYMWLAFQIRKRFSTKVCFHILDDWPNTLYSASPFALIMQPMVQHCFTALSRVSQIRLCIGTDMRDEYRRRYQLEFVPMLNCDDMGRYVQAQPRRALPENVLSIVFSGSIGVGRWRSLLDICEAAEALRRSGIEAHITAYVPDLPPAVAARLENKREILTLLPSLRDREVPGTLKGADILLLAESFDQKDRAAVRLSIATKAHLYMMAQRPILVYGPPDIGVVRYAQSHGWAQVITSPLNLSEELAHFASDTTRQHEVVQKAHETALANHNAPLVRKRLRELIHAAG